MVKIVKPFTNIDDTAEDTAGPNKSLIRKVWQKTALAELNLQLLKDLTQLKIGLNEVEDYVEVLNEKKKVREIEK